MARLLSRKASALVRLRCAGWKSSLAAALRTASRTPGVTRLFPFKTRDTVAALTFAAEAISRKINFFLGGCVFFMLRSSALCPGFCANGQPFESEHQLYREIFPDWRRKFTEARALCLCGWRVLARNSAAVPNEFDWGMFPAMLETLLLTQYALRLNVLDTEVPGTP